MSVWKRGAWKNSHTVYPAAYRRHQLEARPYEFHPTNSLSSILGEAACASGLLPTGSAKPCQTKSETPTMTAVVYPLGTFYLVIICPLLGFGGDGASHGDGTRQAEVSVAYQGKLTTTQLIAAERLRGFPKANGPVLAYAGGILTDNSVLKRHGGHNKPRLLHTLSKYGIVIGYVDSATRTNGIFSSSDENYRLPLSAPAERARTLVSTGTVDNKMLSQVVCTACSRCSWCSGH
jgi:hypothetical protein